MKMIRPTIVTTAEASVASKAIPIAAPSSQSSQVDVLASSMKSLSVSKTQESHLPLLTPTHLLSFFPRSSTKLSPCLMQLEHRFTRNFVCCDIEIDDLHTLLTHIDECHTQQIDQSASDPTESLSFNEPFRHGSSDASCSSDASVPDFWDIAHTGHVISQDTFATQQPPSPALLPMDDFADESAPSFNFSRIYKKTQQQSLESSNDASSLSDNQLAVPFSDIYTPPTLSHTEPDQSTDVEEQFMADLNQDSEWMEDTCEDFNDDDVYMPTTRVSRKESHTISLKRRLPFTKTSNKRSRSVSNDVVPELLPTECHTSPSDISDDNIVDIMKEEAADEATDEASDASFVEPAEQEDLPAAKRQSTKSSKKDNKNKPCPLSTLDPETGERRFICADPSCRKEYKNANGLKYHMSHSHPNGVGLPEDIVDAQRLKDSDEYRPYKCTVVNCPKRYKNLNGLKYHIEHAHSALLPPSANARENKQPMHKPMFAPPMWGHPHFFPFFPFPPPMPMPMNPVMPVQPETESRDLN